MLEINVNCSENACICKSVAENLNCNYILFYLEYDEVCQEYMLLRSHEVHVVRSLKSHGLLVCIRLW